MDSPKISAILLAAGSSTRMGEVNKLLLPFRKKLIIQHLIQELAAAEVDELIIVLGHEAQKVKAQIPKESISVINENHNSGMTSSIQAGIKKAKPEHQGFMICLADQVLMQSSDYNQIIAEWKKVFIADQKCIIVPTYEKQKGNPVIFSSVYRDEILAHKELNGCKGIVKKNSEYLYRVAMENDNVLIDVDTETDFLKISH